MFTETTSDVTNWNKLTIWLHWHHLRLNWYYFRLHWHLLIESDKNPFAYLDQSKQHCLSSSHLKKTLVFVFSSYWVRISKIFHLRLCILFFTSHFILNISFYSQHLILFSTSHFILNINLASSSEDLSFAYLKNLVRFINEHVDRENYAMILKRTKKFKKEIINNTWIICDRERKTHVAKDSSRRHDNNKHIKCSFFIIVKLNEDIQIWLYEVKNAKHNHAFSVVDAHSALRRMTMTEQLQNNALIDWQSHLTDQWKWRRSSINC